MPCTTDGGSDRFEWVIRIADTHKRQTRRWCDRATLRSVAGLESISNAFRRPGSLSDLDERTNEASDLPMQKTSGCEYQIDMQSSPVLPRIHIDAVEGPDG